jgi:hypothetical protein
MNNHLFKEKIIQPPLHHFPVIRFYGVVRLPSIKLCRFNVVGR